MDDTTTTTGSEGNPGAAGGTGSPDDGSVGGTQTADSFADERSRLEQRARDFQSRADREAARANELEARLAALEGATGGDAGGTAATLDPDAVLATIEARFEHRASMKEAAAALRSEFGYADSSLFQRATEFDSVDALRAAVEASHNGIASIVEAKVAEAVEAIKASVLDKYGINLGTPSDSGSGGSGVPALAEIKAMSFAEMDAFERANPGVIDEVLRSAT